jgi:D-serine dehydratase
LLDGDVTLPAAALRTGVVESNAAALQAFLSERGALLAPHGKTTMAPQLFKRQLEAGAWGITVATVTQAGLCHAIGIPRVLIANEVIGVAETAALAKMCADAPDREYLVLIDSIEGARQLDAAFAAEAPLLRAQVLLEFGFPGGRCGVRTIEAAVELARQVGSLNRVQLRGIEGYEGLVVSDDADKDALWVGSYLEKLVEVARRCADEGAFDGVPIISAGGSVYYDLVARLQARGLGDDVQLIVRSGCYLTQDAGFYRRALDHIADRGSAPSLGSALQVWARVLSTPEPGRAILNAGKRDVSFDIDLPVPQELYRAGDTDAPVPLAGWAVTQLSDQHAFAIRQDSSAPQLQVGDVVALGISHPCTTFDKWPLLFEIDDRHRIIGAVRTFF